MKALKPLQYQAARLLAEGHSVSAAARELRIHRSTIHLLLKRPDFSARIQDETRQAMVALRGQTQRHVQETLQRAAFAARSARGKPAQKIFENTDISRHFLATCSAAQKNKPRESEQIRAPLSKSVELPHETTQAPNVPPVAPVPRTKPHTILKHTTETDICGHSVEESQAMTI